jgi:hypothetical protein
MRSLPVPRISAEVSYNTSISRVADVDLKQRLHSILGDVVAASDGLVTAATTGTVASIPPAVAVGSVTAAELKAVYKQRFAKLRTPGRGFYDELVTSAPNGKCPLCAHRDVGTLDHFLPQAAHPALTVAPVNLVPACSDCNKAKLDQTPVSPGTVTLHPYFDTVEAQEWLAAEVQQTAPASVRFWVEPPPQWPEVLARRVAHHFRVFGLAKLYAAQAAEELVNIRLDLERVFEAEGQPGVASHLTYMAASRAHAHTNSWQPATYKAFAASTWFCGGGFEAS